MREIKFRAWDKEDTKWVTPSVDVDDHLVIGLQDGLWLWYDGEWGSTDLYDLMQYTGLKDKNGVEIYEGDVVKKVDYDYGEPEIIAWGFHEDHSSYKSQLGWNLWEDYEYLVIGNIHENPELVGGKND